MFYIKVVNIPRITWPSRPVCSQRTYDRWYSGTRNSRCVWSRILSYTEAVAVWGRALSVFAFVWNCVGVSKVISWRRKVMILILYVVRNNFHLIWANIDTWIWNLYISVFFLESGTWPSIIQCQPYMSVVAVYLNGYISFLYIDIQCITVHFFMFIMFYMFYIWVILPIIDERLYLTFVSVYYHLKEHYGNSFWFF